MPTTIVPRLRIASSNWPTALGGCAFVPFFAGTVDFAGAPAFVGAAASTDCGSVTDSATRRTTMIE